MAAAGRGWVQVVEILLRGGAELDLQARDGGTALMWAASNGHERVVELLQQHGAEVNAQANDGVTALMLAARDGHEPVDEVLLRHSAEINLQASKGYTALMYPAIYGHPAIVLRLLRAGADTKLRADDGKSALQYAKEVARGAGEAGHAGAACHRLGILQRALSVVGTQPCIRARPQQAEHDGGMAIDGWVHQRGVACLLYTSPSPRDRTRSRMPSSA